MTLRAALRRQNCRTLLTADLISLCQKTNDGRYSVGGGGGDDGNDGDQDGDDRKKGLVAQRGSGTL